MAKIRTTWSRSVTTRGAHGLILALALTPVGFACSSSDETDGNGTGGTGTDGPGTGGSGTPSGGRTGTNTGGNDGAPGGAMNSGGGGAGGDDGSAGGSGAFGGDGPGTNTGGRFGGGSGGRFGGGSGGRFGGGSGGTANGENCPAEAPTDGDECERAQGGPGGGGRNRCVYEETSCTCGRNDTWSCFTLPGDP